MDALQKRMATVGLRALAGAGFVLAGGYALRAHGFGERDSDDIDLFTDVPDTERFAKAVERLVEAYREDGLETEVVRQAPLFARLVVSAGGGATAKADLGVDHRRLPPDELAVGPVLSELDSSAPPVRATDRGDEARTRASHPRRTGRESSPLDRQMFAQLLDTTGQIPDKEYAKYGLDSAETAGLKTRMSGWASETRTREANPDIDKSMGLLQTGQIRLDQTQAAASSGEAARQHSPYEQSRGTDDRQR